MLTPATPVAPREFPASTLAVSASVPACSIGKNTWERLEEIGYHGFLTVRPMPGRDAAAQFKAISDRLNQIG